MRTDLHIHTTASDSCWTPELLVKGIVEHGIELFAVTDHDSVDNVIWTESLSEDIPAKFIRGVEISTTFQGHIVHILGYAINPESPALVSVLMENRHELMTMNRQEILKIIELGYHLSYSDYLHYEYDKRRGGWKSLNFLIDHNICKDLADYNDIIRPQLGDSVPAFVSLEDVINAIREAEGFAILAHPGASLLSETLESSLKQFLDCGIAGVECYAQYHDNEITERCVSWSKSNRMLITGGSDYHGGFVKRKLGHPILDHEIDLNLGPIYPQTSYK